MSRTTRVVIPGLPHHITHRGNHQQDTFRDDEDREIYLRLLRKHSRFSRVQVFAYALMTNHVHLIVVPELEESLSVLIQEVHGTYATLFNLRYNLSGHLWHGRFFSSVMDPPHMWNAIRYVELNPVRGSVVGRAEHYRWSSAAGHCGLRQDALLSSLLPGANDIKDWRLWLHCGNAAGVNEYIRDQTLKGHPCGEETYFRSLEKSLGRKLLPRKPGRPVAAGKMG